MLGLFVNAFLGPAIITHLSAVVVLLTYKCCQHINALYFTTCTYHFIYIFIKVDMRWELIGFGSFARCLGAH